MQVRVLSAGLKEGSNPTGSTSTENIMTFKDLDLTDIFKFNGNIYIKLSDAQTSYYGYCFANGNALNLFPSTFDYIRLDLIEQDDEVEKIDLLRPLQV